MLSTLYGDRTTRKEPIFFVQKTMIGSHDRR